MELHNVFPCINVVYAFLLNNKTFYLKKYFLYTKIFFIHFSFCCGASGGLCTWISMWVTLFDIVSDTVH